MVQNVERLDSELGIARTADVDTLREHDVEVRVTRRAGDAHRAVAESPERRRGERIDIEPSVERLIRGCRIADAIRPLGSALSLKRAVAPVDDRDGESGSRLENASHPPASQERVRHGRPSAADVVAAAERQLVGGRENEVVSDVVKRRAPLGLWIVGVLPIGAFGGAGDALQSRATKHAVEATVVGARFPEGVRGEELDAAGGSLAHARLHGVVLAPRSRRRRRDRRDQWERPKERPACVLRCPRRRIADAGQCLIAFDGRDQVARVVTDVTDLSRHR